MPAPRHLPPSHQLCPLLYPLQLPPFRLPALKVLPYHSINLLTLHREQVRAKHLNVSVFKCIELSLGFFLNGDTFFACEAATQFLEDLTSTFPFEGGFGRTLLMFCRQIIKI